MGMWEKSGEEGVRRGSARLGIYAGVPDGVMTTFPPSSVT